MKTGVDKAELGFGIVGLALSLFWLWIVYLYKQGLIEEELRGVINEDDVREVRRNMAAPFGL